MNAWPLDEGLIDYVDGKSYGDTSDENPLFTANVIAATRSASATTRSMSRPSRPKSSGTLHEAGEVEANVAIGYHAIEFLLWGQDLNGTGPGAGDRPASDYDTANCTHGNCDRRAAYLKAATDLLVADLEEMVGNWKPDGAARKELAAKGDRRPALPTILTGLGSLSYGELAGERMKLGLILHDPEEEHDCFSDNTQNSHYYDEVGMISLYSGTYKGRDGKEITGASIRELQPPRRRKRRRRSTRLSKMRAPSCKPIKDKADSGEMAYDQMIGTDNAAGNALVQAAIDALVAQTRAIEAVVTDLGLTIKVEGSDSLDNPSAVQ